MASKQGPIQIGTLKHIIEIQKLTATIDSSGFQQDGWTKYIQTRSKIEFDDRLIKEVFRDAGVDSTIVKIFTFRFCPGLDVKDRILHNGRSYKIYAINNIDESNRFVKVWAREICL